MITLKIIVLILVVLLIILLKFTFTSIGSTDRPKEKVCQLYLYYLDGTYKRSITFNRQMLRQGFTFQWGKQTFAVINVEESEQEIKITAKEYE